MDNLDKEKVVKPNKITEPVEEKAVEKVGDMIRNARTKKKIEIINVAEELCIRRVYLEAIENSNYEALPEHPYGIGFVRSYAEFLGLSSSRMADLYRTELNIKENGEKIFSINEIDSETSVPNKKYIIISIAAVALLYFAWLLLDKYTNDFEDQDSVSVSEEKLETEEFPLQIEDFTTQETSDVVESGGTIEVIDLSNQDLTSEDTQITVDDGVYLVDDDKNTSIDDVIEDKGVEVKMLKRIWFEAKDSKKLYVSKIFDEGTSYKIPDKPDMIISVGDPEAVEVYIDGKLVKDVFTRRRKTNINLDGFLNKKEH